MPDRPARRLTQLLAGLALFGASVGCLLRSGLGLDPWDVLHQGLAQRTGWSIGAIVIGVSVIVLAAWVPLRQRPGIGTVCNVLLVGLAVDAALAVLPVSGSMPHRCLYLAAGILLNGVATGLYVGAGLGPGPRDGLMTGLAARGHSLMRARTVIELTVLAAGWLLGGDVGVGTALYAICIGPLAHYFITLFTIRTPRVDLETKETPCPTS
jgi:uncharacterized membrane protein YczE